MKAKGKREKDFEDEEGRTNMRGEKKERQRRERKGKTRNTQKGQNGEEEEEVKGKRRRREEHKEEEERKEAIRGRIRGSPYVWVNCPSPALACRKKEWPAPPTHHPLKNGASEARRLPPSLSLSLYLSLSLSFSLFCAHCQVAVLQHVVSLSSLELIFCL